MSERAGQPSAQPDRRLEQQVELDATPDQVWEAIATGPGISTWFVPTELEPRAGGAITQRFGSGFDATGRVRAWEPGRRFAYGAAEPPPDGAADYAFEFLVEARDGGGTVLRFVQSGFLDEGWEGEYDSYDKGWALFLGNLRSALTHFPGQPVRNVVTMGYTIASADEAWPVLFGALGLAARPEIGEEITLRPAGLDPLWGEVDVASGEFLGVRSEHGLHRVGAEGAEGCGVSVYHYFYGEPVDADALTAAWQEWLTGLFPAPELTTTT